jgi:Uma2 family endonuclease
MSDPVRPFPTPPRSADLPCCDGEPLESASHRQQMEVLIQSLESAWADRRDFYAGGDMFLYFSETQARNNDFRGPDFFLVLGTDRHERRSWVVWEEGGKAPDVIVELLSESTEHVDRGQKMRVYAQALKVGEYFLFDPWSGVLEGYELDVVRGKYRSKPPDAKGRVYCEQTGLWLGKSKGILYGVEVDWLRWMDAEGRVLPVPEEDARAARADLNVAMSHVGVAVERANAEAERANAEAERANAEAERANQLAREVEELRRRLGSS